MLKRKKRILNLSFFLKEEISSVFEKGNLASYIFPFIDEDSTLKFSPINKDLLFDIYMIKGNRKDFVCSRYIFTLKNILNQKDDVLLSIHKELLKLSSLIIFDTDYKGNFLVEKNKNSKVLFCIFKKNKLISINTTEIRKEKKIIFFDKTEHTMITKISSLIPILKLSHSPKSLDFLGFKSYSYISMSYENIKIDSLISNIKRNKNEALTCDKILSLMLSNLSEEIENLLNKSEMVFKNLFKLEFCELKNKMSQEIVIKDGYSSLIMLKIAKLTDTYCLIVDLCVNLVYSNEQADSLVRFFLEKDRRSLYNIARYVRNEIKFLLNNKKSKRELETVQDFSFYLPEIKWLISIPF